jgi:nitrate reductase NapE component
MVAAVKAFADRHLERFVSKKLLVWLIIATAYVGTQGFVDVVARFKGK